MALWSTPSIQKLGDQERQESRHNWLSSCSDSWSFYDSTMVFTFIFFLQFCKQFACSILFPVFSMKKTFFAIFDFFRVTEIVTPKYIRMLLLDTPIKIPFFADVKNFENFRIRKSRRNRPFLNCQNICNFLFWSLFKRYGSECVYIRLYIQRSF